MGEGRWPTNVILSPGMAEVLDQQSGDLPRSGGARRAKATSEGATGWLGSAAPASVDSGGASRFFTHAWYEPEELAWIYANGLTPYTGQE